MGRFVRPIKNIIQQDNFNQREVGISHPDLPTYIRLNDAGDIEIVVSDGCAIVLHAASQSITFIADSVKFLTKEGDAIRWNNKNLNSNATDFTQPALIPLPVDEMRSLYQGSDHFYAEDDI